MATVLHTTLYSPTSLVFLSKLYASALMRAPWRQHYSPKYYLVFLYASALMRALLGNTLQPYE